MVRVDPERMEILEVRMNLRRLIRGILEDQYEAFTLDITTGFYSS